MGLLGGRIVGLLGGSLISLLPFGFHEWLSAPMAALVGLVAGEIRDLIPEKEDIWHFGPFQFLNIPMWLWRLVRYRKGNWAMLPLFACAACEVAWIGKWLSTSPNPHWLFAIDPHNWEYMALVVLSSVMCVAVAVKIWNNTRIEMNLEQNQHCFLLKARMDALTSQINPHFLFNTLNTVSSLIPRFGPGYGSWRGPETFKYSCDACASTKRLRMLCAKSLAFIDDYLDIEVIRFGRDKLQFFTGSGRRHTGNLRPQHVASTHD